MPKFWNNFKYLLDDICENYRTIIDKGEFHEDYVYRPFRYFCQGQTQTQTTSYNALKVSGIQADII